MGQAKRRGSYEKRKAEAIVRNAELERQRLAEFEQRKAERYARMTKREREKMTQVRAVLAAGMGAASEAIAIRPHGVDVDTY